MPQTDTPSFEGISKPPPSAGGDALNFAGIPKRAATTASEVTKLVPAEEQQFQTWAKTNAPDLNEPDAFYDYRGYWKSVKGAARPKDPSGKFGHLPDTFKQHGHPTFSVESQYSKGAADGGRWEGDKFIPAPPAKKPTGQFLGASTKPASIRAGGGVLFESLPFLTGAAGGTVGIVAGAPTAAVSGLVGPATAGVLGAGVGGLLGRYAQHLLQQFAGGTKVGDFAGIPPLVPADAKSHPIIGELGKEATTQMEYEMSGAVLAAPLGFIMRGGFLKRTAAMDTLRESTARGTRLSGPEIASGTRIGEFGKSIQAYAAGSFFGGPIQREVREKGTASAMKELDDAVNLLTAAPRVETPPVRLDPRVSGLPPEAPPYSGPERRTGAGRPPAGLSDRRMAELVGRAGPTGRELPPRPEVGVPPSRPPRVDVTGRAKVEAGRAIEAGVGAARSAQAGIGQQMEQVAKAADPVDMTGIKQEALKEFQDLIVSPTATFPDLAGSTWAARLIRSLRNDPSMAQRMPRPAMLAVADAILEKTNSPRLKFLRSILGAEDNANFHGVWKQSQMLRSGATPDDAIYAKNDIQRLSTRFAGLFRQELGKASPEFDRLSSLYGRGARVLNSHAIQKIFKAAVDEPESVVKLFTDHPTRAAQLQRTLKAVAARGPDKERAAAAYDVVRSTYLQHEIIQGSQPIPTDEAGMDKMLRGISDRLNAGRQSGVLKQWYSDPRGVEVLRNLDTIAGLMKKRTIPTTGRLRQIFEISRAVGALVAAGGAMAAGRSIPGSAVTTALAWEAIPDFFVWVVHDPRATKWFIQGVSAENPTVASAGMIRLMELFRQTHAQHQQQHRSSALPKAVGQ